MHCTLAVPFLLCRLVSKWGIQGLLTGSNDMCYSVPQGSIMLFNIQRKTLGKDLSEFRMKDHQYADGMQLYYFFSQNPGEVNDSLNQWLDLVMA